MSSSEGSVELTIAENGVAITLVMACRRGASTAKEVLQAKARSELASKYRAVNKLPSPTPNANHCINILDIEKSKLRLAVNRGVWDAVEVCALFK